MNKNRAIWVLSFICIVLTVLIIHLIKQDNSSEELIRSEERVKSLELQKKTLESQYDSLLIIDEKYRDSLGQKPKERVQIKYKYYEKTTDIISLSADSSIKFCSDRLSEINLN